VSCTVGLEDGYDYDAAGQGTSDSNGGAVDVDHDGATKWRSALHTQARTGTNASLRKLTVGRIAAGQFEDFR